MSARVVLLLLFYSKKVVPELYFSHCADLKKTVKKVKINLMDA